MTNVRRLRPFDLKRLDARKLNEIKHSDRRRSIVRAYEYHTDASADQLKALGYVDGKDEFKQHFSNMKFYSITRSSFVWRDRFLYKNIQGVVALDFCCGNGEVAIEMAQKGAKKVTGIDISQVAIENGKALAASQGLDKICEFHVMDAENTVFSDNTFDIIHEYGALHHLDLDTALKELARILKPGGKVVCTEALRHNPLIHWYRKRTPHLRTKWEAEHILGVYEIMSGKKYFDEITLRYFHLGALLAVPFRNTLFFKPMLAPLEIIDNFLLRIPYLQRMAWVAVYQYRKPKK